MWWHPCDASTREIRGRRMANSQPVWLHSKILLIRTKGQAAGAMTHGLRAYHTQAKLSLEPQSTGQKRVQWHMPVTSGMGRVRGSLGLAGREGKRVRGPWGSLAGIGESQGTLGLTGRDGESQGIPGAHWRRWGEGQCVPGAC